LKHFEVCLLFMAKKSILPNTRRTSPPLPGALGLLSACAVTLIGVTGGLSPEIILMRSMIAGSVAFLLTAMMLMYWKAVSPSQEEDP